MRSQLPHQRTLPPDARIIPPASQPQRYTAALEKPTGGETHFTPPKKKGSLAGAIFAELLETIVPALIIAMGIHFFLAEATLVEGYSMEPTLFGHQRVIIEKVSYKLHAPERGDIIVIKVPQYNELYIKRIIGLPGETLEIREGVVYINGQALQEPYVNGTPRGYYPSLTIPEGYVFVMGDNRNNSIDSRSFGPIPLENIVGHAWMRYWPPNEFGLMP